MVLHEEQHPKLGNGSITGCIGRSSKRNKPKKIPQRGLGVAQLEKLRLEEQKKNAGSSSPPPSSPAQDHPNLFPLSADRNSAPLRHPIPVSSASVDLLNAPYPLENSRVDLGGSIGHGFLPMLWNAAEPNTIEAETMMRRLGFHVILPNEYTNSGRQPPSGVLQRRHLQPMPSIPLVNKFLSPTTSSGVGLQIEPPSNQNYSSNYKFPSCTEEERMVGMKRPWSFHLDSISNPFPCQVTPSSSSANMKDSISFGNELIRCEAKATPVRVGSSSASASYADWRTSDLNNWNTSKGSDGSFLTLGTPAPSVSYNKQSQVIQPPLIQDHVGNNFSPSQGSMYSAGNYSHPFYSFLPGGPSICGTTLNEQESEIADGVDLSLKL